MDNANKLICPQCTGQNNCRIGSTEPCWCAGRPVSKEALESALGEFSLDKTCLCASCLAKFETSQDNPLGPNPQGSKS